MKNSILDMAELCYYIFEECIKQWGISYKDLANLISKYKLYNRIERHIEDYNLIGEINAVKDFKKFIEQNGGVINAK